MNATNARDNGDSWRWAALAALPALLVVAWQASFVWPYFSDDAFISLRYSERLLAGDGLTWTDGERVEGYSNLLWVLLCALLGGLGVDLVFAARALGALATAAALVFLADALRPHDARSAATAAAAPLLVASTQVVLGWTLGGLEGPLVLCLLSWGFALLLRARAADPCVAEWPRATLLRASVPFALLCATRPDGPLWALVTGVALALVACGTLAARVRTAYWFGLVPVAVFAAQLAFRVAYYGDFVPNTAHVKADFDPAAFGAGVDYVLAAARAHAGLFVAAALACAAIAVRQQARALGVLLALPVAAWLVYLAAIGGDHFPCRRLLHGALAPLALLVGVALREVATTRVLVAPLAAIALLGVAANVWLARTDAQSHELRAELWEWRGRAAGHALQRAFGGRPTTIAVDAAGALPFYSRLPAIDMLGLCDRTIATTPEPGWLATMRPGIPRPPGHLRGNGRYVIGRAPDLIMFGNPPGMPLPVFVSGCEFEDDPRFLDCYRGVLIDLGEQRLTANVADRVVLSLWLRVHGMAGVQTLGDRMDVPAYLFGSLRLRVPVQRRYQPGPTDVEELAANLAQHDEVAAWYGARNAVAVPHTRGNWWLELRDTRPAACDVPLLDGHWRARVEPADAEVEVTPAAIGNRGDQSRRITIAARPGAALPVRVQTIVFERER